MLNGGLMSQVKRVIAICAVLCGLVVAGTPVAHADSVSRKAFAAYYVVIWMNQPTENKEMFCIAFRPNPKDVIARAARLAMNEFNTYFGPKWKPPVQVSYTDAFFVVNRAIPYDCSAAGRKTWNLKF